MRAHTFMSFATHNKCKIKSCIQTRSRCYRTRITTYCTLLGNDPPSIVTRSSGFVSRPAFVPEDGKTNHRLISLGKIHFKKGCIRATGVKSSPRETMFVIETKNICRELNSSTGAIGLSIGEIGIFLDSRVNPIPKPAPTSSSRQPGVVFP